MNVTGKLFSSAERLVALPPAAVLQRGVGSFHQKGRSVNHWTVGQVRQVKVFTLPDAGELPGTAFFN